MAHLHVMRTHALCRKDARALAQRWEEEAVSSLGMRCAPVAGDDGAQRVRFSRPGVEGTLTVTDQRFELEAQLGFLLSAFKDRIEAEIGRNLDQLLGNACETPAANGTGGDGAPP
jgi:putative polyhydroxyalkanoate system protein